MPWKSHATRPPIEWQQALQLVLEAAQPCSSGNLALREAIGCVSACSLQSPIDVPPYPNSQVDGYALHAEDVSLAAVQRPTRLRMIGRVPAGCFFRGIVGPGETVEVAAGIPMPEGTDAVVKAEWAHQPADGHVEILRSVESGTGVRHAGADTKSGDWIIGEGEVVTPAISGLLSSCGISEQRVVARPRIVLVSAGGAPPITQSVTGIRIAKLPDPNQPMLLGLLRTWGFEPSVLTPDFDEMEHLSAAVAESIDRHDVIVANVGRALGQMDRLRENLYTLGCEEVFGRVNQHPGGPFLFARRAEKLVFALPEKPVSAFVCAELFLRPALLRMSGFRFESHETVRVALGQDLRKPHARTAFLRGRLGFDGGRLLVRTTGPQDPTLIRSIVGHDGYIVFPASERVLSEGTPVRFIVTNREKLASLAAEMMQ